LTVVEAIAVEDAGDENLVGLPKPDRKNREVQPMRKFLFVALSAAGLLGAALWSDRADAMSIGGAAGIQSAQDQLSLTEPVARVCRRDCDDGFCRTRCFHVDDDDDFHDRDRRVFRDRDHDHDRRDFDRDRDHDRDRDRRDCSRVGPVVVCN
jgi:hypothetical protein